MSLLSRTCQGLRIFVRTTVEVPVYVKTDYVRPVLRGTGLGRHVCQLARITINFEKGRGDSAGIREWITNDMLDFAKANPGIVIYLKPIRHKAPYYIAQYLNGREVGVHLSNYSRTQVANWVNYARTRSGQQIVKFEHDWNTDNPSVQGVWNPLSNQATENNVAEYPDPKPHVPYGEASMLTQEVVKMMHEEGVGNVTVLE